MKEEFDALFAEHQKLLGELQAMRAVAKPEQELWRESASDYERGVIDGRQMQMQSSVDKAVNAMSRTWVGLTDDDLRQIILVAIGVAEAKLKEKNND